MGLCSTTASTFFRIIVPPKEHQVSEHQSTWRTAARELFSASSFRYVHEYHIWTYNTSARTPIADGLNCSQNWGVVMRASDNLKSWSSSPCFNTANDKPKSVLAQMILLAVLSPVLQLSCFVENIWVCHTTIKSNSVWTQEHIKTRDKSHSPRQGLHGSPER